MLESRRTQRSMSNNTEMQCSGVDESLTLGGSQPLGEEVGCDGTINNSRLPEALCLDDEPSLTGIQLHELHGHMMGLLVCCPAFSLSRATCFSHPLTRRRPQ